MILRVIQGKKQPEAALSCGSTVIVNSERGACMTSMRAARAAGNADDALLRNGCSVALGRDDGEGDLQLVFHFYCAAAYFYGGYAVVGLQDGELALAVELVGIDAHS
jgi:hypothetical protein